jgi:hypothetical protein
LRQERRRAPLAAGFRRTRPHRAHQCAARTHRGGVPGISSAGVRIRPSAKHWIDHDVAVQLDHVAAAGPRVQSVDVLRDERESGRAPLQVGRARWPALGATVAKRSRRHTSHTVLGFAANASGVAGPRAGIATKGRSSRLRERGCRIRRKCRHRSGRQRVGAFSRSARARSRLSSIGNDFGLECVSPQIYSTLTRCVSSVPGRVFLRCLGGRRFGAARAKGRTVLTTPHPAKESFWSWQWERMRDGLPKLPPGGWNLPAVRTDHGALGAPMPSRR